MVVKDKSLLVSVVARGVKAFNCHSHSPMKLVNRRIEGEGQANATTGKVLVSKGEFIITGGRHAALGRGCSIRGQKSHVSLHSPFLFLPTHYDRRATDRANQYEFCFGRLLCVVPWR